MAEFRVRFIGDLGNLSAFNSAIRNSLSSNAAILERANSSVVSRALGEKVQPPRSSGAGLFVRNATTEIDRLNNSFIQSGATVRRYQEGFTTEVRKVKDAITGLTYDKSFTRPAFTESFLGSFKKAQGNVEAYERAIARLAPIEKQWLTTRGIASRKDTNIANVEAQVGAYAALPTKKQTEVQRQAIYNNVNRLSPGLLTGPGDLEQVPGSDVGIGATVSKIQNNLHQQRVTIQKSLRDELKALQNDPVIRAIEQNAFYAATSPEGRLGRQTTNILNQYPSIRQDLEKKLNLGGGQPFVLKDGKTLNPQYAINAQNKDFEISNVYRDMERGLTRVSGSARGADEIMTQFSYTIDKNKNVVNSWGRNLAGARGFLQQTTRDLVKVVEWTVATTAVFGALGLAFSSVSKINEMNVNLQRFAITARLSNEELTKMFDGLSRVAFSTATPINELIKAADDMALATRRANQSTTEWQASILELANAVGILTNISGLDTVRATELLVASMKQLNLQTKDLVPLLSSITAAAGGQSASITDIATALATLAEAADAARIPLAGQIAAIQVISQVTGKSADQTASAFKNLFGAINSDASIKKLAEFGIAVRDLTTGELRPFLDIYRDVADKLRSGVIPQGRLNEVLRAISGGRTGRQADAAALLANIYKVSEVQNIAASSSNEALIANAKILDTNQAKITRFQNSFDITVFKKFNETVASLTSTLADLGTVFAGVFGNIPTQIISLVVQLIALATAIKLLSRAGAALNLGGFFGGLKKNLFPAGTIQGLAEAPPPQYSSIRLQAYTEPANPLLSRYGRGPQNPLDTGPILNTSQTTTTLGTYGTYQEARAASPDGIIRRTSTGYNVVERGIAVPPLPYLPRGKPPIPTIADAYRTGVYPSRTGTLGELPQVNLTQRMTDLGFPPIALEGETKSIMQRFIGIFGKTAGSRIGKFGLGAAVGAGAAVAGGGNLAGLASLAGSALLFTPAAPIGAGLIIGGAIIDHFTQQTEDAKKKVADLQSTLYNLTLEWKQDAAGVDAATTSYNKIVSGLQNVGKGTQEYIDLQGQLGEATLDLAIAQDTQTASTKNIIDAVKQLAVITKDDSFKNFANGLVGQNLTPDQLKGLVGLVSEQLLAASGQPVSRPNLTDANGKPLPSPTLNYNPPSNTPISYLPNNGAATSRVDITADELRSNTSVFNQLLDTIKFSSSLGLNPYDNPAIKFPFDNPAAVSAFNDQLQTKLAGLPPDQQRDFIDNIITPFHDAVTEFGNATSQVGQLLQDTQAEIGARKLLGLLSGKDAQVADVNITAATKLQGYIDSPRAALSPTGVGPDDRGGPTGANQRVSNDTILKLQQNALTGTFDPKLLKTAAEESIKSLGVWNKFPTDIARTTAEAKILREEFGLTDEQIVKSIGSLGNLKTAASEALETAIAKTKEWADSGLADVGQKLLDLQSRLQGGEFKDNPKLYQFLKAQLDSIQQAYGETANGVIDTITEVSGAFNAALGDNSGKAVDALTASLTSLGVVGFLGVKGSIDDVNSAFINMITRLNLSGPEIAKVIGVWISALSIFTRLQILSQQIGLLGSTPVPKNYTGGPASLGQFDQYSSKLAEYTALINQLKGITKTGTGTTTPFSTKTGSGPKATTSTLYLSKEQEKLADPLAVVKQAYADALKLQAQIPGEAKKNKLNTVVVFDELQKIFSARGISEELLRKALDSLTEQMSLANQKANVIRRIHVGSGDFSAIANVPVNSATGVSVGASNQINITFNLNGITSLSPANIEMLKNAIGAEIARRL